MPVTYPCELTETFCGLSQTKLFLGLAGVTEHDILLQTMLEEVTSDFQNYMDRWIFINDWYEKFDIEIGQQQQCIQLKEYPIVSISKLTDASLALTEDDYLIYEETGQVCLDEFYFSKGLQSVGICYRAGYSPSCIPPKLAAACKEEVYRRFGGGDPGAGDISYEKIGDYAYRKSTYTDTAKWRTYGFSSRVRRILDYFRDSPL
ncbi:hypothetical protein ES702_07007 [subsurface metagenome]